MPNERNPDFDAPQAKPEQGRTYPNPPEDISSHSRPENMREEAECGPDGSGEAPETDNQPQIGRGAD